MDVQEKKYWVALQTGMGTGIYAIAGQIIEYYGSAGAFWRAGDTVRLPGLPEKTREKLIIVRKKYEPDKLWEICGQKKAGVLCFLEEEYPKELLHFSDCPVIIYYYGDKYLLNRPAAAIVGSRRCSAYGRKMAGMFAEAFAGAGLCVVSGMAKGIDAAAHEGALEAGGDTVAVFGCGADLIYPPENRNLYWRLREKGLVISEFFPGDKPEPWHFPLRNRIISGLGRFLLLIEGAARSGALITCSWAAEQGKDVWALPGPVTNPYSIGPLQLIRDGASPAITPQDMLRIYGPEKEPEKKREKEPDDEPERKPEREAEKESAALLSPREKKLYAAISYDPVHVDGLLTSYTGAQGKIPDVGENLTGGNLYLDLTKLITLRLIERLPGDYYQRI